jgi:hypothetical protein
MSERLTETELGVLASFAEGTPRALVIGTMRLRSVIASLLDEVRAARAPREDDPRDALLRDIVAADDAWKQGPLAGPHSLLDAIERARAALRALDAAGYAPHSTQHQPQQGGTMTTEQIAKVCHEANRAYCETLGDLSQPRWEDAPEWQRTSAIKGVEAARNPLAKPSDSHDSWLAEKRSTGWKYGPVKDPAKKEHPCFVPYEELPIDQKAKDALFLAVARALL